MSRAYSEQNNTNTKMEQKETAFEGLRDVGQAEDILNRFQRENPNEESKIAELLDELLDALLSSQEMLTGSADDFHNFSVSISKISSDNYWAHHIAKLGLILHADNTDLLADAILYGKNCGERKDCSEWYKRLLQIDKTAWTWRAFSFSIDYLLEEYASKQVDQKDILQLVKEYQKYKPNEEDAWLSEFDLYNYTNNRERGMDALIEADRRFKLCPKCWLRIADIKMDEGEYDEAEKYIKKLKRNPKSGESVNMSYVFLLDGLCRMSKMISTDAYDDGEYDEKEILRIYKSFNIAVSMSGYRENIRLQIVEQIDRLEKETEIAYPYERP